VLLTTNRRQSEEMGATRSEEERKERIKAPTSSSRSTVSSQGSTLRSSSHALVTVWFMVC
jgi:hypothetical protein